MLYPKIQIKKHSEFKKIKNIMCTKRSFINGFQCIGLFLIKSLHF